MAVARPISCLACALALAACRASPAPEVALDGADRPAPAADFPAPARLLQGFDPRADDRAWRAGDEALYGLRVLRDGDVRHWLLRLEVLEPEPADDAGRALGAVDWELRINGALQRFASRRCRVRATVMDERGDVLGETSPLLPRDFLARGIADACALVHGDGRRWRKAPAAGGADAGRLDVRPLAEATVSAVALLQIVQHDDVLSPLLWEVVERPSLWSVVKNLGAKVVLRPRFQAVRKAASPVPGVPVATWRLPISLYVNDEPALHVDLFVADPSPPFALGGGVLGATARHPTRPDLEFSLRLLSARRGSGGSAGAR